MKIKVKEVFDEDFGYRPQDSVIEFTTLQDGTIMSYGRSLPF